MLSYINSKGIQIKLTVQRHAYNRFLDRWNKLHPEDRLTPHTLSEKFNETFNVSNRVKCFSRKDKVRLKRYGKFTLFFRGKEFTFVVENASIVTVEISDEFKRHLN